MALTQASLSSKLYAAITAIWGTPADGTRLQEFCDAIADAIVDEITSNAVVTASGADPQGGTQNVTGTVS